MYHYPLHDLQETVLLLTQLQPLFHYFIAFVFGLTELNTGCFKKFYLLGYVE
jgi:hypothetical protein